MIVELTDSESEDDELIIVGSEKKAESDESAAKVSAMMAQFASEDGEGKRVSRNEEKKLGNAAVSDGSSFLSLDPAPLSEVPLSEKIRRPAKVISYSDDDSDGSDEGMSFIQRIAAQLKASNETLGLVDPPSPISKPQQARGSSSRAVCPTCTANLIDAILESSASGTGMGMRKGHFYFFPSLLFMPFVRGEAAVVARSDFLTMPCGFSGCLWPSRAWKGWRGRQRRWQRTWKERARGEQR